MKTILKTTIVSLLLVLAVPMVSAFNGEVKSNFENAPGDDGIATIFYGGATLTIGGMEMEGTALISTITIDSHFTKACSGDFVSTIDYTYSFETIFNNLVAGAGSGTGSYSKNSALGTHSETTTFDWNGLAFANTDSAPGFGWDVRTLEHINTTTGWIKAGLTPGSFDFSGSLDVGSTVNNLLEKLPIIISPSQASTTNMAMLETAILAGDVHMSIDGVGTYLANYEIIFGPECDGDDIADFAQLLQKLCGGDSRQLNLCNALPM